MNIAELITRSLLGIATEKERQQLQAWLDAEPAHREEYARIVERLRKDLLAASVTVLVNVIVWFGTMTK